MVAGGGGGVVPPGRDFAAGQREADGGRGRGLPEDLVHAANPRELRGQGFHSAVGWSP